MPSSEFVSALLDDVRSLASSGATVMVLEGETDVAFLQGLIDDIEFISLGGRSSVLAVATEVTKDASLDGVVLVVDSDFDRITGRIYDHAGQMHLVFTDAHDIEVMIVSVDNLRLRVLRTLLRCTVVEALNVWAPALDFASEMGLVRLVAHLEGWPVKLDGVRYDSVQNGDGTTNRGELVSQLMPRLMSAGLLSGPGEMMRLIESCERWRADWPQLVNGHELCGAISAAARHSLGRNVGAEAIEASFRVAYQRTHLAGTRLGARLREWCTAKQRPVLI